MVGKGALTADVTTTKERPVFIPPRKRQQNKAEAKKQNYVDHIVNVQVCSLIIAISFNNKMHVYISIHIVS